MKGIKGKKIIITGASSGIGESLAWKIAEKGGIPILIARNAAKLSKLKDNIFQRQGITAFIYTIDLADPEKWAETLKQIVAAHAPVHGLINNAGMGVFQKVEHMRWEDTDQMFTVNVLALIKAVQVVLPHFQANQSGHIVNIASQSGKIATPKSAVYGATKHAVLGFTNALRLEVGHQGIFVTGVNLGPVRTNFFHTADPTGKYQKAVNRYMLDPDEVAEKVTKILFKQKREINMPYWMDIGSKIYQLFPALMETLMRKQFNKK